MTAVLTEDTDADLRLARISSRMNHPTGAPIASADVEFLVGLQRTRPELAEQLAARANIRAHRGDGVASFDAATVLSTLAARREV